MTVFDLWLPVLVSGIGTHIASTLAWTVLPHHRPEWQPIPNEDGFLDWLDENRIEPRQYIFPYSNDGKEMASAEFRQKVEARCRGMLVLWPTPTNMAKAIVQTLTYFLVTAFILGYLASKAMPAGDSFTNVFQFVFSASLLAHCLSPFPNAFWFRRRFAMDLVDGLVYCLITGLVFAAMWPQA